MKIQTYEIKEEFSYLKKCLNKDAIKEKEEEYKQKHLTELLYIPPSTFDVKNFHYSIFEKLLIDNFKTIFYAMIKNPNSPQNQYIFRIYAWHFLLAQYNNIFNTTISYNNFKKKEIHDTFNTIFELDFLKYTYIESEKIKIENIETFKEFIIDFLNIHNSYLDNYIYNNTDKIISNNSDYYYSINSFVYRTKSPNNKISINIFLNDNIFNSFNIIIPKTI